MLRGVYTAGSGMLVEAMKADIAANNLANADTRGFKRQNVSVRSFPEMLIHRINDPIRVGTRLVDPRPAIGYLGTGAAIDEAGLDPTAGIYRYTGRALDVAVEGPGFLAVELPSGAVAYTRDGGLVVSPDGYLATAEGLRVLGEGGPIFVGDQEPRISEDGSVLVGGEVVGTIRLWEFPEPRLLERLGANLLAPTEASGPAQLAVESRLRPQHVEGANVNVVREMVDLINIQRAYEANQRVLRAHDETLGLLINEVPRLA